PDMNKSVPLFLAAAVLLAAFVAWFAFSRSDRGGRGAPAPAPVAAPAETPAPVELASAAPIVEAPKEQPAPAPAALTAAPAVQEESRSAADSGGRRIVGRVLAPSGAPADATLRVIAMPRALPPREIYGDGGVLADLAAGKGERCLGT